MAALIRLVLVLVFAATVVGYGRLSEAAEKSKLKEKVELMTKPKTPEECHSDPDNTTEPQSPSSPATTPATPIPPPPPSDDDTPCEDKFPEATTIDPLGENCVTVSIPGRKGCKKPTKKEVVVKLTVPDPLSSQCGCDSSQNGFKVFVKDDVNGVCKVGGRLFKNLENENCCKPMGKKWSKDRSKCIAVEKGDELYISAWFENTLKKRKDVQVCFIFECCKVKKWF